MAHLKVSYRVLEPIEGTKDYRGLPEYDWKHYTGIQIGSSHNSLLVRRDDGQLAWIEITMNNILSTEWVEKP